jgi:hypothetical protein
MSIPQGMKPTDATVLGPAPQQLHKSDGEQVCAKEIAAWRSHRGDFEQAQGCLHHLT